MSAEESRQEVVRDHGETRTNKTIWENGKKTGMEAQIVVRGGEV